jgi:hypothetical protein
MVTMSKGYWVANVRSPSPLYGQNGRRVKKQAITKQDQQATFEVLEKLGLCGKSTKYRYLSDRRFKTEAEARAFYLQHTSSIGLLDKMLTIHEQFDLIF